MLICGGINIYPIDLENILYQHSLIEYAQAYAVDDVDLGQCLAVKIILKQYLDINQLQDWISQKAPRYLRPKSIFIIDQIESDSIGKPI
jgi:acyl-CoA synthetase (AMP-forming)/AMP-acid ligase II